MKVENMKSSKGNKVANQFIVIDDNGSSFFQSYESIIAKIDKEGNVFLDEKYWNYSVTTSKYRNEFLGLSTQGTKEAIASGIIQLVDLN